MTIFKTEDEPVKAYSYSAVRMYRGICKVFSTCLSSGAGGSIHGGQIRIRRSTAPPPPQESTVLVSTSRSARDTVIGSLLKFHSLVISFKKLTLKIWSLNNEFLFTTSLFCLETTRWPRIELTPKRVLTSKFWKASAIQFARKALISED